MIQKSIKLKRTGTAGRWSLFRPKVNDTAHRYQGFVTEIGRQRFEHARDDLRNLSQQILGAHAPTIISDADTFEYLARGKAEAMRCLRELREEIAARQRAI